MPPLKLTALDADDLAIISAHMQDAVLTVGDIRYLTGARSSPSSSTGSTGKRLPARMAPRNAAAPACSLRACAAYGRRRSGARRRMPCCRCSPSASRPGENPPEGEIELTFSGGGALRLDVECIEAAMKDLGEAWATRSIPRHALEDEGSS